MYWILTTYIILNTSYYNIGYRIYWSSITYNIHPEEVPTGISAFDADASLSERVRTGWARVRSAQVRAYDDRA